jgi:hypothetical protein
MFGGLFFLFRINGLAGSQVGDLTENGQDAHPNLDAVAGG